MHPVLNRLIDNFRARTPLRTGSLIVTIFGDCVSTRGGEVWLGSLIDLLDPLQISHRLVRTAVFRLVQDNILTNEQIGRRSFYRLTTQGQLEFNAATERIYSNPSPLWDGQWLTVLSHLVDPPHKAEVKTILAAAGLAQLSSDTFAHPCADVSLLHSPAAKQPYLDQLIFCRGHFQTNHPDTLQQLVRRSWPLAELDHAYAAFIEQFAPVAGSQLVTLSPQDAFLVRTFLVHEYRKVLLRDPGLPDALLPADYRRTDAYSIAKEIYLALQALSEQYVDQAFVTRHGPLPPYAAQPRFVS